MKVQIRLARIQDAKSIGRVVQQAIRRVNSADYTPRQILAWSKNNSDERIKERLEKKKVFFVLTNGVSIIGVASIRLSKKLITSLFIHPSEIKKGFGARLLRRLELYARKNGLSHLSVHSSKTAFPFYIHAGYERIRSINPVINGAKIPSILMRKKLHK